MRAEPVTLYCQFCHRWLLTAYENGAYDIAGEAATSLEGAITIPRGQTPLSGFVRVTIKSAWCLFWLCRFRAFFTRGAPSFRKAIADARGA